MYNISSTRYACDPTPPCTSDDACSGHGICNNTTGTCECFPGYIGSTMYFSYRDCHIHLSTQIALAIVTIVFAFLSGSLATLALIKMCCSTHDAKRKRNSQSSKRKMLLFVIYVRTVVASSVSIWLESLLLVENLNEDSSRIYEVVGMAGVLRSLFPWLIIGNASYATDTIIKLVPLNFLKRHQKQAALDSAVMPSSMSQVDFDAIRFKSLAAFEKVYWLYDLLLLGIFLSLAVLSQYPQFCGCWCASTVEISIGTSCLPILYFSNNGIYVLHGIIFRSERKDGNEHSENISWGACCLNFCNSLWIAAGFGVSQKLLCESNSVASDRSASQRNKAKAVIFKLKVFHFTAMAAAWGAFILCLIVGINGNMLRNADIWVRFTMWFAHMFSFFIIIAISGNKCPLKCNSTTIASSSPRQYSVN